MFAKFMQIFSPKNKDLRKKILLTFGILFIFKLGTAIIVPAPNLQIQVGNLGFLELINAMGGGALKQFSIFGLGVMPYITASIIMQLLQLDIIPYFSDLAKEGQTGRAKLNKITRVMGIVIAFIQGYLMSMAFVSNGSPLMYMEIAVVMTAGTAFLLWLGDQITQKGIGNGISLIIMAGIITSLPTMFKTAFDMLMSSAVNNVVGVLLFIGFILLYVLILIGVIFTETAERRIPIQYANKSTASLGRQNYIPFKLNPSGVTPVIFASALISIPGILAGFIKNDGFNNVVENYLSMNTVTGFILYLLFIFVFAYIYTFIQMKPKEMAENLQKNGGYIPGIRPGEETNKYVSSILKKITLVGACALALIASLPQIFSALSGFPQSVTVGGTGLIIVVGVALETYKQLTSQLNSRNYSESQGRRRRRR